MRLETGLIALSIALLAAPAVAQDEGDVRVEPMTPAIEAEWQNPAEVQRVFVRETAGFSRFEARPAMKIGLMIEADGTVGECLPLALEQGGPAYGKELCPSIFEHARFAPARDAAGNAVRSVYVAYFEAYRPGSAAQNRDFG